jgi:hypothetical protein
MQIAHAYIDQDKINVIVDIDKDHIGTVSIWFDDLTDIEIEKVKYGNVQLLEPKINENDLTIEPIENILEDNLNCIY